MSNARPNDADPRAEPTGKVIDPVCGMQVDPATAKYQSVHADQTFHFCSASCKKKFDADPAAWLGQSAPASAGC